MNLDDFIRTRPNLYHLTAKANLPRIRSTGNLVPAADLFESAGLVGRIRARRRGGEFIEVGGQQIHIRDQAPLHQGNMRLHTGWRFEDFVEHLNRHVFFWPGSESAPISYGRRHFERYRNDDCVVIVLDTSAVFDANGDLEPLFCRFNSGSPRCTGGKGSPRGPTTFARSADFDGTPSSVVEVTYRGKVRLPTRDLVVRRVQDF